MKRGSLTALRRRAFTLLEVVIALAIVALCAIPLIAPHLWMVQTERSLNQTLQIDRNVGLIWTHIVEQIYKNAYSWDELTRGNPPIVVAVEQIPEIPASWPYDVTFTSKGVKDKEGNEGGETWQLLEIAITATPKNGEHAITTAPYLLFVDRKIKIGEEGVKSTPPPDDEEDEEEYDDIQE